MARGWESKSVEEQQAEARSQKEGSRHQLTPAQLLQKRQLESLTLMRHRIEQQLTAAREPRYQEMLRRALTDLDAQISRIAQST